MAGVDILHAQTMTPQVLVSKFLGTSEVAVYTTPANSSAKLSTAVLCNTGSSTANVTVSLVPTGDTLGTKNRVISDYQLLPGDTLSLTPYLVGTMLTAGDVVTAKSTVASAVAMVVSGLVQG